MATTNARQSIHEADPDRQVHQRSLPPGPTHIASRSTQTRASNEAMAWLVVQSVTPAVYDFGVELAKKVRYATAADGRRKVRPGELLCYPLQATMARERGCSVRQVKRYVRALRLVGLEVRQRVRPYGAAYVFPAVPSAVPSSVPSDVPSHREPRTEPKKNHVRSSRARVVCQNCGHTWPDKPEYGTTCYRCQQPATSQQRRQEQRPPLEKPARKDKTAPMTPEALAKLETEAIENGYHKRDDGSWTKGPQPTTDAAPPPPAETETPPTDGGEPGPNERRFKAELAKWTKKGRRRRTALRTA